MAEAGAAAGAGADAADSGTPKSGSSPKGPLVALIPGAGLVVENSGTGS
jgi:hypothetical protein